MRIIWTLLKVVIGLAVAIPLTIVVLGLTVGVLGALLGLAIMALKLACVGLIAYGVFRVARRFFGPSPKAPAPIVRELPEAADRYYAAAMRELDKELGVN